MLEEKGSLKVQAKIGKTLKCLVESQLLFCYQSCIIQLLAMMFLVVRIKESPVTIIGISGYRVR